LGGLAGGGLPGAGVSGHFGGGRLLVAAIATGKGRRRKIKLKATYIWLNEVGRYFFLFFLRFLWCFCAFLNKGSSKKTKTKLFGGSPCQKLLAEKAEKTNTFFLSSFPIDFFIAFLVFGRFSA
jgi:hypothetical protein